jgi:hypothetical protein
MRIWNIAAVILAVGRVCSIPLSMYIFVVRRANPAKLITAFPASHVVTTTVFFNPTLAAGAFFGIR